MNEDNIETAPNVPPFVRYVASTIPMVFDNSLSYYEALGALAKSLQDTVDVVNNNGTVTEEYIQLTKDMKEYMDHYFDNLDVQEEINNKLDEMVTDGSLQQLINNYFADVDEKIGTINLELNQRLNDQDADINTIRTETNARLASQDGDIQTLETRMDSFSSLTEGSTTGDAELIDGRIAFDGRTFSSIGDNIRNYQDAGYTDITATLTQTSGKYIHKSGSEQTGAGYSYYTLQTEVDKSYLIDCVAGDTAPQVVYGKASSATNYCIPTNPTAGAGTYNKPIIIRGTGGNVYINNLNSNTHFYVGELDNELGETEFTKYFKDITADCTVESGKYITKSGNITTLSGGTLYEIPTPTAGKIYRVYTGVITNVPVAYQSGNLVYPADPANIPNHGVGSYYDIYCPSSASSLYINSIPAELLGGNVKIYESIFTYTTPLQQDIKSDVGAFDKAFFIGDSLTYGQTYTASNQSYRNYYNYPYYLKKLLQINEITEVARSGATAQSWWSSYNDQITQTDTCYFIWLGTNDAYTDTVATDCAGDDYTQFAETATGYLGKIVGKVASLSNVKIVMLNNFATVGTKATNNKVINDIATKFGALVIDINNTSVSDSGYHTAYNGYYNSVHFNNQGHNYVANIVANDLMTYMNAHQGSFELYKVHA